MGVIDDFIDYYKKHLVYTTNGCKCPEKYLKEKLIDIDETYLFKTLKHIKSRNMRFINFSGSGRFNPYRNILAFQANNKLDTRTMFHELGHGVDHLSCKKVEKKHRHYVGTEIKEITRSNSMILSNGLTLNETVKNEVKEHASAYNTIMLDKYNTEVIDKIDSSFMETYKKNKELLDEYKKLSRIFPSCRVITLERRKTYNPNDPITYYDYQKHYKTKEEAYVAYNRKKELESYFGTFKECNRINREFRNTKEFKEFVNKYSIVLDMLSSYDSFWGEVSGHSESYFKREGSFGGEFFAECFSAKATKNDELIQITKKFFPKSINAFEELMSKLF